MRWLYRLIFLDKFPWLSNWLGLSAPLTTVPTVETVEILYQSELDYLKRLLSEQLQEPVYYSISENGKAIIGTVEDTIARLTLHSKGNERRYVFVLITLEDNYEQHKAWFQLAFLGFRVRFRRPILELRTSSEVPSRGR